MQELGTMPLVGSVLNGVGVFAHEVAALQLSHELNKRQVKVTENVLGSLSFENAMTQLRKNNYFGLDQSNWYCGDAHVLSIHASIYTIPM